MSTRIASFVCGLSVIGLLSGIAGATERTVPIPRVPAADGDAKRSKLSGELRELIRARRLPGPAAQSAATVQVVVQTRPENADTVKASVQAVDGTYEMTAGDLVLARVPVSSLETLASSNAVQVIRTPRAPTPFRTTSEGVNFIGAAAWQLAGRKGAGVKVAILDVGFSGYSSLMGTELPQIPSAHIKSFSGDITGDSEEHGTGVAEVVYDVAPEAELYLVNFSNEVELDNAVQWLIDQHVNVINASWGYPCGGPADGTGRTNAAVQKAADAGILWVNAAGNYAQRHWSSTFNDPDGNGWHNFSADDQGNTVSMNSGDDLRVCVEWDDWTNKDQDLELYVWDSSGSVVKSSTEDQSGPNTHDPWERLDFTASTTGNYYIGIKRYRGTRNPRLHLYAYPPGEECAIEAATSSDATPQSLLGDLREFRDLVLAPSPTGRAWIDSYYRHSSEVRRLLLLHPSLAIEAAALLNASRPVVRSIVAARSGQSSVPFVFTQEYVTRVDRFLDQLVALGSSGLRNDLDEFRGTAAFSAAAGQSADRYWEGLLVESPLDSTAQPQKAYPEAGYMLFTTAGTSIVPPADSPNAFTVGAIDWSTGALEEFSSQGPTADGRMKPDVVAPDGVCTATFAECGANGFRGTSASAPHAAGAAALVRGAYPSFNVAAVRNFLTGRAVDAGAVGPDNQTGMGRLALGSTTDSDILAAPTLIHPIGNTSPLSPGYLWSEVNGASGYRLMIAVTRSALPVDSTVQTCSGCIVNTTTPNTYFTHPICLVPTTTYYWQVQGVGVAKNGPWAQSSFTTTVAPEQTPPEPIEISENPGAWSIPAGKAVVITHGWNSKAVNSWVQETAQKLCEKLGVSSTTSPQATKSLTKMCQAGGWDVWIMDWSDQATVFGNTPIGAFSNAIQVGEALASHLKLKNYTHVHFIAHSAGANLINSATVDLKLWAQKEKRPEVEIHDTFLDAYEPTGDASRYGKWSDWADNYVDTRSVDFYLGLDGTKLFLSNAYNVNVTPIGNPDCGIFCRHSRPYRFYGESIDDSFVGDASDANEDPISTTGVMGYLLSVETNRSLTSLKSAYPIGKQCIMRGAACQAEEAFLWRLLFNAVRVTQAINATFGAVNYVPGARALFDSLKLGFVGQSPTATQGSMRAAPAAAPTEAPSWIVVDATTTEPANLLRLKWRFGSGGEGLLRVFVDGTMVREIDQRYVPTTSSEAEEIYIGGAAGTLAPGTHRVVFRLDGFAASASGVELTGVELGLAAPATRRRSVRQ